ncbi:hypothetical protein AGMMS49593_08350 [Endomicrobiia bacterium]|nr:hypothetical protein AGMMS49593_08350 [Endomicrobiia bacterium]
MQGVLLENLFFYRTTTPSDEGHFRLVDMYSQTAANDLRNVTSVSMSSAIKDYIEKSDSIAGINMFGIAERTRNGIVTVTGKSEIKSTTSSMVYNLLFENFADQSKYAFANTQYCFIHSFDEYSGTSIKVSNRDTKSVAMNISGMFTNKVYIFNFIAIGKGV